MAYKYHVELSSGQAYTVTTDNYHDDGPYETFAQQLLRLIETYAAGVDPGLTVQKITYRGRE